MRDYVKILHSQKESQLLVSRVLRRVDSQDAAFCLRVGCAGRGAVVAVAWRRTISD